MKLYMKQHIFTWGDKFSIYDESGQEIYFVEGEVFSWGKKLHIYDNNRREIAFIRQKVFSFLPKYYISVNGEDVAEVVKEFTFFMPTRYSISGLGWSVDGDFFEHEYTIDSETQGIARISKEWFSWGDAYEIDVYSNDDAINALAVVLIIDACIASSGNSSTNN